MSNYYFYMEFAIVIEKYVNTSPSSWDFSSNNMQIKDY